MQDDFWNAKWGQQLVLAVLVLGGMPVKAGLLDDAVEAIRGGETKFNFRYRFEHVDQDSFSRDANASTLRSRIGFSTGDLRGWTALVEADQLSVIGPERFNSTENGRGDFPVVADPEGFDLNQALLRYKSDKLTATFGRQRINHADQRFIGGVAWRQNEQTYDGVRLQSTLSLSQPRNTSLALLLICSILRTTTARQTQLKHLGLLTTVVSARLRLLQRLQRRKTMKTARSTTKQSSTLLPPVIRLSR